MKFTAGLAPATPEPPEAAADDVPPDRGGWHVSSLELKEGLTVIDDPDITVPGDLFDR